MRRNWVWIGVAGALLLAGHSLLWSQALRQPAVRKPPGTWDRRVLDSFFAEIEREVGPGTPGSGGRVAGTPGSAGSSTGSGSTNPAPSGGIQWSRLVSAEVLENEIKSSVLALEDMVSTPARFKAGRHNDARITFTTLAAVFSVIAEYDAQVRFKDNALALRNALGRAGINCKVNSDGAYFEAKQRFEDLQTIVRGSRVDLPEPEPDVDFAKYVAERTAIMKRMDVSYRDALKGQTGSREAYQQHKDRVVHEAQIMAMLVRTLLRPGYDDAEDEEYAQHAVQIETMCREIVEAAQRDDFPRLQTAVGNIDKACNNCHAVYR
jgi:hypothetical protein